MMRRRSAMAARRAVMRWALRMFRREWRQQLLVIALLTVAVGASVFAATAAYNAAPSRDAEFGRGSHRLEYGVRGVAELDSYEAAAEEWFDTVDVIGHREVAVAGSSERVELRTHDPNGALSGPMLALRSGSYPSTIGEVALTDDTAAMFDVDIGDAVTLGGEEKTVVGLVENPNALDDDFALVVRAPDTPPERVTVLIDASEDRVDEFNRAADAPGTGFFQSRGQTEKAMSAVLVLVVATLAMLLVSLVAAAGFVVVAQRRLRQLGTLAAIGATPRHLRLVMLANGLAVGAIAATVGTTAGLLGWTAAAPTLESAAGHRIDRFDVPWWLVACGVLLALVTAVAAAWWPARSVARVPVTLALSGRPPRPKPTHRSALVALLLGAAGVACLAAGIDVANDNSNALLLIGGTLAMVLAVPFMATPALRALAALGGRLPVGVRLALRDLSRYRARSGAALGAISLALGIAIATVLVAAATEYRADEGNLPDHQILVRIGDPELSLDLLVPDPAPADVDRLRAEVDRFADSLDNAQVVPFEVAVDPTIAESQHLQLMRPAVMLARPVGDVLRDSGLVYVATPALLGHLGLDPSAIDPDALLLTTHPGDVHFVGDFSDTRWRHDPVPEVQRIDLPSYTSAPRSLITERGLGEGAWRATPAGWIVESAQPFTDAELVAARDMADDAGLTVEARSHQGGLSTVRSAASAAGVLLALGILALTVGLIRAESAGDLRTLAATGATSRTRRAVTASTAGALALLAVVLGLLSAYAAVIAGYWPDTDQLRSVPVAHLAAIAVGLPLIAFAASWLLAGREPADLGRQPAE